MVNYASKGSASMKRKTILVLEDSLEWAALYQSLIELIDCDAFVATNGMEGLKILATIPAPDLILLDFDMPQMNGLEFYQEFQKTAAYDGIKIILTSESPHASRIAKQLKVFAHAPKSLPVGELLELAKQALGLPPTEV
jgi:two-component system chemotaxis response regulator CheY